MRRAVLYITATFAPVCFWFNGVLHAGDRKRQLVVGPGQQVAVTLQLIAHTSGSLPMPQIQLAAPAYDASVDVCQARRIFVVPRPLASVGPGPHQGSLSPRAFPQAQAITAG